MTSAPTNTTTKTSTSPPLFFFFQTHRNIITESDLPPSPEGKKASYGAIPAFIQQRLRHYQTLCERRPDHFIRHTYPALLDENRAAAARLLRAPRLDDLVFVQNATVGVNVVLRALADAWHPDGRDDVLHFTTVYGACGRTIAYVTDASRGLARPRAVALAYPVSDAEVLARFRAAVADARAAGRRPRLALFDALSSTPGVRFPFEALVRACRELGVLSLVDAAQAAGAVPLDLAALDPDFLVTNFHKWLFVPRACAALYVPLRNQHLIRSTVPTSHGYVPREKEKEMAGAGSAASSGKSPFVTNFEYVGTLDNAPFLCIRDAIEWRARVLGGEERIMEYVWGLAGTGGEKVAEVLGTWVMQTEKGRMPGEGGMVNVALPLVILDDGGSGVASEQQPEAAEEGFRMREGDVEDAAPVKSLGNDNIEKVRAGKHETVIPRRDAERVWEWMMKVLDDEYQTFVPVYYHAGRFWVRLSAQVYLDMDDFDWAGKTLKELCERVARKEYDL